MNSVSEADIPAKPGFRFWTLCGQTEDVMKSIFHSRVPVLCAFCRSPRHIERKRHVGLIDYLGSGLGAAAITAIVFGGFDPRGLLLFAVFVIGAEVFVQMRWRMNLQCPHCGFDPVLYGRSPEEAAAKVKTRLEARKNDPRALLGRPLQIPVRRITDEERRRKGQNLEREL